MVDWTFKKVETQLLSYDQTYLDYPFGEEIAVYKIKLPKGDKMFALLVEKKDILRLSLKCDPVLAETLRDKFASVTPGYHLSKKHWNTIILTGELSWQEIVDLMGHSYRLVSGVTS